MTALYRFVEVRYTDSERAYSFTLNSGDIRLLQLSGKAEKEAIIDLAVGEKLCDAGSIEIILGDRRHNREEQSPIHQERRQRKQFAPEVWSLLQESRLGRVGWVAGNGGLISNLKVWENVTLPLWYHTKRDTAETEKSVEYWLTMLGLDPSAFTKFMAAPPFGLEPWERKLAGLLRGLVQMPRVLVVDAGVFEDVNAVLAKNWIAALTVYASHGRAVLVLADKATVLPWEQIE
jgi:predicted ABC-type transport system involved in lysophospholipase L1 biosynthesis ATPase subunit